MNLNTANLKVGLAASTDPARVNLNSIHVTATHTEATNGYILARVSLPYQYPIEDIPATIPTEPAENLQGFIIPAKPAMAVKLFKKNLLHCLVDTLYVDIEKTNPNGTAKFTATDLESTISPELKKIDGDFPDLDRVLPTFDEENPPYHVKLNIAYLETLLAIAKSIGTEFVTIDGGTKYSQSPVVLKAENLDTMQKFTGVIMPVKE